MTDSTPDTTDNPLTVLYRAMREVVPEHPHSLERFAEAQRVRAELAKQGFSVVSNDVVAKAAVLDSLLSYLDEAPWSNLDGTLRLDLSNRLREDLKERLSDMS